MVEIEKIAINQVEVLVLTRGSQSFFNSQAVLRGPFGPYFSKTRPLNYISS
jgi:hypothetical protein